ncbi:MAG: hypothetical protein ABWY52_08970 [Candidatus Limnocylindrales bacterium]
MKRPIGVTLLGILSLAAGISFLLLGLQLMGAVTFGPLQSGTGVWAYGLLVTLTGLAFGAAGFAFWSLQPWAWLFGHILAIFGLIEAVLVWLTTDNFGAGVATGLFPLLVLWYLNREPVKKAFGQVDA